jgi:hypothetical protein
MILWLTISRFTALHVVRSFIGIAPRLIALPAFAAGRWMPRMTALNNLAHNGTGTAVPLGARASVCPRGTV